ncbi:MAG: DUF192 domain-containing protein [Candidatus Paceibacterota bacterium]
MFKKVLSFLIIVIILLLGFFLITRFSENLTSENIKYVKIAGQNIKVDLALTKETQQQGLSGRSELKEDEGMLFIFNHEGLYSFWMKDMNFPIDIIWINKNLEVVDMKKNVLPESYPENFVPKENAKYVLEIVAGFGEKNNLKEGDSIEFK